MSKDLYKRIGSAITFFQDYNNDETLDIIKPLENLKLYSNENEDEYVFNTKDISKAFGIKNIDKIITTFDDIEKKEGYYTRNNGKQKKSTFLTKYGVYRIIFHSYNDEVSKLYRNIIYKIIDTATLTKKQLREHLENNKELLDNVTSELFDKYKNDIEFEKKEKENWKYIQDKKSKNNSELQEEINILRGKIDQLNSDNQELLENNKEFKLMFMNSTKTIKELLHCEERSKLEKIKINCMKKVYVNIVYYETLQTIKNIPKTFDLKLFKNLELTIKDNIKHNNEDLLEIYKQYNLPLVLSSSPIHSSKIFTFSFFYVYKSIALKTIENILENEYNYKLLGKKIIFFSSFSDIEETVIENTY